MAWTYVLPVARGSGWHNIHHFTDETEKAVLFGLSNDLPTEWCITLTGGSTAPSACVNSQLYYALWVPVVRTITIGPNGFATVTNNVN